MQGDESVYFRREWEGKCEVVCFKTTLSSKSESLRRVSMRAPILHRHIPPPPSLPFTPAEWQKGANGCCYAPTPRASVAGDTPLSLSPRPPV